MIDIDSSPVKDVLCELLEDWTTGKNIIWATDTYKELGDAFKDRAQMKVESLCNHKDLIRPRNLKSQEEQVQRTRRKAEVFTPAWLCNLMNNHCDEDWFGRRGVFNVENEDRTWTVTPGKIAFPKNKASKRTRKTAWQRYVDSRRLEIACGEAPFLVSRYDAATGERMMPLNRRIGILDRKLRIVGENTDTDEQWLTWARRAFEATYGYEYQGDNVLIARINLLLTFADYYEDRMGKQPDNEKLLKDVASIIARNIWQMDGLKGTVPLGKPYAEYEQLNLFDLPATDGEGDDAQAAIPCRIYNWRSKRPLRFQDLRNR